MPCPSAIARTGLVLALLSPFSCASKGGAPNKERGRAPGGDGASSVNQPFPSQAELDAIASKPAAPVDESRVLPTTVGEWTVASPVRSTFGQAKYTGDAADAGVISNALPAGKQLDEGLMCVAQEHGRFYLQHGAVPPADIGMFIKARCGAAFSDLAFRRFVQPGPLPPVTPEFAATGLGGLPNHKRLGFWAGTDGENSIAIFLGGSSTIDIEPFTFDNLPGGEVEIRGTLANPLEYLSATASRGELGAIPCEAQATKSELQFAFVCRVDTGREHTIVDISGAPRGQILSRHLLAVLLAGGDAPPRYVAPTLQLPIDASDTSATALVTSINALRQGEGLDPVTVSTKQAEVAKGLLPHLTSPRTDPKLRNMVVLGLMAGWHVEGVIRRGTFVTSQERADMPIDRMLASMIFVPSRRASLLSSRTEVVATATHDTVGGKMRMTLVSSFERFGDEDHSAHIEATFDELDRQRRARGNGPVIRVDGPRAIRLVQQSTTRLRDGVSAPEAELERLSGELVKEFNRSFASILFAPMLLEGWRPDFPSELLDASEPQVVVSIGYFSPAGQAWGQHSVFVVFTTD
ncbi:MAG: hypothetical protein AAF721_11025 [Myxococcota bacterium]